MKKFLVGIMSIFLLIGGGLLSACTVGQGNIVLDSQSVEIELNGGEGTYQITANVYGGNDSKVDVSWSGYENYLSASASQSASGKNTITIKGTKEIEDAQVLVTAVGCQPKVIDVTIYSYVSSMSQKIEIGDNKKNFLIKGETNILNEENLLDMKPSSNSRREIHWSLAENNDKVAIDGNSITIADDFLEKEITLIATNTLKSPNQTDDVQPCEVTLPVFGNLKDVEKNDIKLRVGYGDFGELVDKTYDIVSNGNDENPLYQLDAQITYSGDLEVTSFISSTDGKLSEGMLKVTKNGFSVEGYPKFIIRSNEDYSSLNGEFDIKFKIGYKGYDYSVELDDVVHVRIREVINEVVLSDLTETLDEDSVKTIYTKYALSTTGELIKVALKPQTVIDAEYKYTIKVQIPASQLANFAEYGQEGFSPLILKYKDRTGAEQSRNFVNSTDANGVKVEGLYEISGLSVNTVNIMFLVSAELKSGVDIIDEIVVTITSDDEPSAYASFNALLTRAVVDFESALSVYNPENNSTSTLEKDFSFILNSNDVENSVKKQFKLVGQNSISGLHVKSNSKLVTIEDEIILKKSGEEDGKPYVIFEVTAKLNSSAYGETELSTYEFYHDNGTMLQEPLKSKLKLDIFLPLTDASISYDSTSKIASVVSAHYNKSDLDDSANSNGLSSSLTSIILKNNTITPIFAKFNRTSNGKEADPNVSVHFVDLTKEAYNLMLSISSLLEGLNAGTQETQEQSDFVEIKIENNTIKSIKSIGVGKTYAIFKFTGKSENGQSKTIQRILKIESFVSADGLLLSQEKDRNITIYASDTIADEDEGQTKKTIWIYFANSNITYANIETNFVFESEDIGKGNFKIENKFLGENYIKFDVVGLTTGENPIYNGNLEIHYKVYEGESVIIDIWTTLKVTILNAQRVESVIWRNEREEGLEFEIDDKDKQALVFDVSPTNAKNSDLKYLVSDKDGNIQTGKTFVKISEISSSQIAVSLDTNTKVKGSLIVYPEDMVHGGNIKYYYKNSASVEQSGFVSLNDIAQIKAGSQTWFDFLTQSAYFISYKGVDESGNPQRQEIGFDKILKKIDIIVVDGSSFEYSYRIYSSEDFKNIQENKFYTLKNSVEITVGDGEKVVKQIQTFNGGLQGGNENVSITFNKGSLNLVKTLNGTIRNLTLIGDVKGAGFVCDINNGIIENVIIDTKGTYASVLTATGDCVGGIVGENTNTITNVGVLGLAINGSASKIGGVAGKNSGAIYDARVELYNLQTGETTYDTNKFEGSDSATIAGLVAEAVRGSRIERCYVYDYTLTSGDNGKKNTSNAPFIGNVTGDGTENAKVRYSFAVVGFETLTIEDVFPANVDYEDVYNAYYNDTTYTSVESVKNDNNFVNSGEIGFKDYVNGGESHLKDLYQDEKTSAINLNEKDVSCNDYKQVIVTEDKEYYFMYYSVVDGVNKLSQTAQNDLDKLNTISISSLVGDENIKVASSDEKIIKIVGNNLIVKQTGDVTLTFSSRQDASLKQEKDIHVIYAFNGFKISYGTIDDVDKAKISIQKTKSAEFSGEFLKTDVYLGNEAKCYSLHNLNFSNDFVLKVTTEGTTNKVGFERMGAGFVFTATTTTNSVDTTISLQGKIGEKTIKHTSFMKTFDIHPEEGSISIQYSAEQVVLTPSINDSITVVVKTTKTDDSLIPTILDNQQKLQVENSENSYTFSRGGKKIINITIENEKTPTDDTEIKEYTYIVKFEINDEYKNSVREEETFSVYFTTSTQNESGIINLVLNRQKFNSIDVTNSIITNTYFEKGKDVHNVGKRTSTLAPGNSSVMQISVNPKFAYYDYMEVQYSNLNNNGVSVAGAVYIELLNESSDHTFISDRNKNFGIVGNAYRYVPTDGKPERINLKIWINTIVEEDSTICFTISFFLNSGEKIDWVNYYLDISYLKEPRITVDGENTAFLAKGEEAEIKIDVLLNQSISSLVIEGTTTGILIDSLKEQSRDLVKGIKTYTATIRAYLNAKVADQSIGTFSIKAVVKRNLNGFEETKQAVATVVLVEFKIDEDNILIGEKIGEKQVLTVWAGVPKTLQINYNFVPQDYSTGKSVDDIIVKRNEFINKGYYPSQGDVGSSNYIINYRDKSLNNNKDYQRVSIKERLFYVNDGIEYSLDSGKEITVDEVEDKNAITITGNIKAGKTVSMVLYTFLTADNKEKVIKTYFTIKIESFSEPDLPLVINGADDFLELAPEFDSQNDEREARDYILINDVVLENYTPFDTTYISSLDGNGYTIYIKSFKMPEDGTKFNIGLFENVTQNTLLKNVRVNLYEGGQLTVNTSQFKDINVAGFALSNKGIITNCEVVAFSDGKYKLPSNKKAGINLFLTNGINTSQEISIADNLKLDVEVAGFVLDNSGSITNSRVGGESIYLIKDEQKGSDGANNGYTNAEQIDLDNFYIVGQGLMSGFVGKNSGVIGASFAKNIGIENKSNISQNLDGQDLFVAGFVGENSGRIVTSYVEGVTAIGKEKETAKTGSSIKSQGIIAGFTYSNNSQISDAYSNILISTSQGSGNVMFASGFVYKNDGKITNGFSACQIQSDKFTQMNFSGVDLNGTSQQNGEYENCYFYPADDDLVANVDETTEIQYSTGAKIILDPTIISSFYGFAISSSEDDDGIWRIEDGKVSLIEPDRISFSHRYVRYINGSIYEGNTREDENGSYILPYATLILGGTSVDTSLGGVTNPIIISNAKDFVAVMGESTSTYIKKYFEDDIIFGTYRLVNEINLQNLITENSSYMLPSSSKSFSGRFYGNGFTIENITLTSSNEQIVSYGLFKSLESSVRSSAEVGKSKLFKPVVTNLTLNVDGVIAGDVPMVGTLAGYIKDATIVSVDVNFSDNAEIVGCNYVGGLAGYTFGSSVVKNVTINNPSTYAIYYTSKPSYALTEKDLLSFRLKASTISNITTFDNTFIQQSMRKYSYAGALFGFVDIYNDTQKSFDYTEYQNKNYSINNIKIRGIVNAKAMVVGGAIGLSGPQTYVNDVSVIIDGSSVENQSHLYAMLGYAGGVIGQAFGGVSRVYAQHTDEVQNVIERDIHLYYSGNTSVERGILDLFVGQEDYTQRAIGGLIGYAGSGLLEISYSKLNVTSPTATYAGGIIGEVASTISYNAKPTITNAFNTTYLIYEVYATGDVRSNLKDEKGKAGGIVGATNGGTLSLLSVNAYNYLTNYNYKERKTIQLVAGTTNLSLSFKVNAFVGSVLNGKGEPIEKTDIKGFFENGVEFIQGREKGEISNASLKHTVSYYASYDFGGVAYGIKPMDGIKENAYSDNENDDKYVYAITGPANFTTTDSTNTHDGFLKSEVWLEENWTHNANKLFPEILCRTNVGKVYLDCYNVAHVFQQMRHNNIAVVVRGKVSPTEDVYKDIDLSQDEYNNLRAVEGFYGSLSGGEFYTTDRNTPVKIISNKNFIASTKEGFTIKNLTVEYKSNPGDEFIEINAQNASNVGLFVNSTITSARISNLTIVLDTGVKFKNAGGSVGLVAPEIINSTIRSLKVEAAEGFGKSLLTIENSDTTLTDVGIIAGKIIQNSKLSNMNISEISVDANKNALISVSSFVEKSVGGVVGTIQRDKDALYLIVNTALNTGSIFVENDGKKQQTIIEENSSEDFFVGGTIGLVEGVNELSIIDGYEAINVETEIRKLDANLYSGAVFGSIRNVSGLTSGKNKNVSLQANIGGKLEITPKETATAKDIYAGGFVGQMASSSATELDLCGFGASYSVSGQTTKDDNGKTTIKTIKAKNAYIGGLVGLNGSKSAETGTTSATANIKITNNTTSKNDTTTGVAGNITVTTDAFAGGLIGKSTAEVCIDSTAQMKIVNSITLNGGTNLYFGGLVGKMEAAFTFNAPEGAIIQGEATLNGATIGYAGGVVGCSSGNVIIKGDDADDEKTCLNLIRYDGSVTSSDVKTIYFGGMLGEISQTGTVSLSCTITYSSFGGKLEVQGSNSGTVYAGGTVGQIGDANHGVSGEISHAYNYGDVFVNYDFNNGLKGLTNYYFGGAVANISTSSSPTENGVTLNNIYSLVTSHNSRYSTASKETAHAIVGVGAEKEKIGENVMYNHKVCLLTDDIATDVGYTVRYSDDYCGYNDSNEAEITLAGSSGVIFKAVETRQGTSIKGSKLYPSTFNDVTAKEETSEGNTNGIVYVSSKTITANSSKGIYQINNAGEPIMNQSWKLPFYNYALIYESNKAIKFNSNSDDDYGLINKLSGYSFVSGFVVENNRVIKNETAYNYTSYGGLVGEGTINTIIYACQATGSIEVGGTGKVAVAGLVGRTSGKVFDSSTDINILYRAGSGGWISGLVCQVGEDAGAIVENCYTGGEITTYISANCFAIGEINAQDSSAAFPTTYQNCYSYTHFDLNDYVDGSFTGETYLIGGTTIHDNIFYDKNACETTFSGYGSDIILFKKDENDTWEPAWKDVAKTVTGKLGYYVDNGINVPYNITWEIDMRFNYGYPTLKYGYLKNSSFAYIAELNDIKQQGTSGYDQYVYDITYTRRENGYNIDISKDWASTNNYFMIPNATILNSLSYFHKSEKDCSYLDQQFILTNDIDLTATILASGLRTIYLTFKGVFDGQGYTIKGLEISLFKKVQGDSPNQSAFQKVYIDDKTTSLLAYYGVNSDNTQKQSKGIVLNLRLTDANLTSGEGLLAGTISNAFVSNMTLSGNITNESSGTVTIGGLACSIDGGQIACVTNLTMVTARKTSGNNTQNANVHIGGLAGAVKNCRISYCSNYGPINATSEVESYSILAGGLVGYVQDSQTTIEYSYNATSVLSGYAKPGATELEKTNNQYYAGGIVARCGSGSLTINNCYNSGIIKAGNKSQSNGAYAAGIIADGGGNTTLSNCYNEGSIEALGKNPEYETTVETSNNMKFEITTVKNVFAGGVFATSDGITTSESTNNYSKGKDDVILNGTGYTGELGGFEFGTLTIDAISAWTWLHNGGTNFAMSIETKKISSDTGSLFVLSQDEFGLPLVGEIKHSLRYDLKVRGGYNQAFLPASTPQNITDLWDMKWWELSCATSAIEKNYNELLFKNDQEEGSPSSLYASKLDAAKVGEYSRESVSFCYSQKGCETKSVSIGGKSINFLSSGVLNLNKEISGKIVLNGDVFYKKGFGDALTVYGNDYMLINDHLQNITLNDTNVINVSDEGSSNDTNVINVSDEGSSSLTLNNSSLYGKLQKGALSANCSNSDFYGWYLGENEDITISCNVNFYGAIFALNSTNTDIQGKNIKIEKADFSNKGILKAGNGGLSKELDGQDSTIQNGKVFKTKTEEIFGIAGGVYDSNGNAISKVSCGKSSVENNYTIVGAGACETEITEEVAIFTIKDKVGEVNITMNCKEYYPGYEISLEGSIGKLINKVQEYLPHTSAGEEFEITELE